jgi:hypothetical protein
MRDNAYRKLLENDEGVVASATPDGTAFCQQLDHRIGFLFFPLLPMPIW